MSDRSIAIEFLMKLRRRAPHILAFGLMGVIASSLLAYYQPASYISKMVVKTESITFTETESSKKTRLILAEMFSDSKISKHFANEFVNSFTERNPDDPIATLSLWAGEEIKERSTFVSWFSNYLSSDQVSSLKERSRTPATGFLFLIGAQKDEGLSITIRSRSEGMHRKVIGPAMRALKSSIKAFEERQTKLATEVLRDKRSQMLTILANSQEADKIANQELDKKLYKQEISIYGLFSELSKSPGTPSHCDRILDQSDKGALRKRLACFLTGGLDQKAQRIAQNIEKELQVREDDLAKAEELRRTLETERFNLAGAISESIESYTDLSNRLPMPIYGTDVPIDNFYEGRTRSGVIWAAGGFVVGIAFAIFLQLIIMLAHEIRIAKDS